MTSWRLVVGLYLTVGASCSSDGWAELCVTSSSPPTPSSRLQVCVVRRPTEPGELVHDLATPELGTLVMTNRSGDELDLSAVSIQLTHASGADSCACLPCGDTAPREQRGCASASRSLTVPASGATVWTVSLACDPSSAEWGEGNACR